MIKTLFATLACILVLQSSSAFAQAASGEQGVPGCGDPKIKFDVQTSKVHNPAKPDAQKALLYLIEDDKDFNSFPKPTTRVGIDGEWTGATHGNSYLRVSIDPGVHHLCTSWQSSLPALGQGIQTAATHFTAQPGGIYYFEVKNSLIPETGHPGSAGIADIKLRALDSDEGQLQANRYKLSTSHPKS